MTTLQQGVRELAEDLRRRTTDHIATGRGVPYYSAPWVASELEKLLVIHRSDGEVDAAEIRNRLGEDDTLRAGALGDCSLTEPCDTCLSATRRILAAVRVHLSGTTR